MLIHKLICDLCKAEYAGVYGEHGHQLRRRSREHGWQQGRLYGSNGGLVWMGDGPMDFCPACVRKEYERRALRPQTA
jgi:hypothetical protein